MKIFKSTGDGFSMLWIYGMLLLHTFLNILIFTLMVDVFPGSHGTAKTPFTFFSNV